MKTQQDQQATSELNDMIYYAWELLKILERNIKEDQQTTDKLNKIVSDTYLNYYPNNNTSKGQDRFKQYNKLSNDLNTVLEKYSASKHKTDHSLKNLSELIEKLENIKLSLQK